MVIKIEKRKTKYYLVVFVALIFGFMFHLDRSMNMDFNRWQDLMETIRYSGMSLTELMEDKTHLLKWINVTLPYMYSFDVLLFFVSKHFTNNYVMVWISVVIDYAIVAYIAYDWRRDSKYSQKEVILSILICFAFLPIIHVCSGLRTGTAACFMGLAVYNYLYKEKSIINFAILCFFSLTFHPFTAFAIPIALVIRLSTKKIVFYITILSCLFISRIADIFSKSGNVFLRSLATKYSTYTSEGQFRAYRFVMYGVIVFSVIVILFYLFAYRMREDEKANNRHSLLSFFTGTRTLLGENTNKQRLYLFFASYSALLIGNIGSYEMVCRSVYVIGALAPVITELLFSNSHNGKIRVAIVLRLITILLLVYICLNWIRYYYPYFLHL